MQSALAVKLEGFETARVEPAGISLLKASLPSSDYSLFQCTLKSKLAIDLEITFS